MSKHVSKKVMQRRRVIPAADLDYGPVYVKRGIHKGRIGYYDGDCGDGKRRGVVFFGDMIYVIAHCGGGHYLINEEYLALPTTNQ